MRTLQSGFTLLELLATMMLMGLLLTLGLPSMTHMVKESRLSSAAYTLAGDLNLARSEAVRTGQITLFCHSDAANAQCRTTADPDGWQESGWLVGPDDDQNQEIDDDPATGQPNTYRESNDFGFGVKVNTPTTAGFESAIWFYPDGSIRNSAQRRGSATFVLCASDADATGRSVEIRTTGAVRIDKTDQIIEASSC